MLSQNLNNIQRLLNYVLILFIPIQFGLHFWPDFSFIRGARIDYLSPTLHVTDIIVFSLFVLWLFSKNKFLISNFQFLIKSQFPILFFAVCLIIGIALSKSPQAGIYGLIKFAEFVFLGVYTAKNIGKLKFENILLMFSIGVIFESLLAIGQYFNHGSFQGIFYFFGERLFNSQTPGIANASLSGELVLRPYGTFPHPNVLAGYLIIAMSLLIFNLKKKFYLLVLLIGTIALFLTLSRVAILVWLIILGFWFIPKIKNKIGLLVVLVCIGSIVTVTPLGARFTDLKLTDESIVQRESLIQSSILMIKANSLFGVGLNNFLINLPRYEIIQPVHNVFLLVLAEAGIIGFSFFAWFLFKTYKRIRSSYYLLLISCLLFLGMFDHYFLTLQQGQLLSSFILGLAWSQRQSK